MLIYVARFHEKVTSLMLNSIT